MFDNGVSPDGDEGIRGADVRRELGAVMYAPNVLGSRGPRKMQVRGGGKGRGGPGAVHWVFCVRAGIVWMWFVVNVIGKSVRVAVGLSDYMMVGLDDYFCHH